jgi:UDP-N-acetylglucosamine diphosphorylase / glucose-1-phosphate thymidylyltransferase / UDP-N-acetylgalactosamine diphosphorylase / glucosamine-1-phosphate N-acetyltransferase / galactosamine-1-phosphate N-acetyltransferase
MNIGLFEDSGCRDLLPLTWLRSCCELRCGRDRLIDKVRTHWGPRIVRLWLREPVREVVGERIELDPQTPGADWLLVNARVLLTGPTAPPATGIAWVRNGTLVAAGVTAADVENLTDRFFFDDENVRAWLMARAFRIEPLPDAVSLIAHPWDLPLANAEELRRQCIERGGVHEGKIHPGAHLLNPAEIHVASGAVVKPGVVLDAEEGPIQIDSGAEIQANAVIQGPAYVGPHSIIRPGAILRGGVTIGPVCKIGGEIEATIFQGYSNKQNYGFLGHSFVGEWVNLGAGTVTSDLKNTYGAIRVYLNGVGVESGQHFIGSMIGDHSKTGIGTILPTGCVIGIASNVFRQSAVPRFVPSFAWVTDEEMTNYRVEKAINIARVVMARRDVHLSEAEVRLLRNAAERAREIEAAGWQ